MMPAAQVIQIASVLDIPRGSLQTIVSPYRRRTFTGPQYTAGRRLVEGQRLKNSRRGDGWGGRKEMRALEEVTTGPRTFASDASGKCGARK
jgi:hypothetical protein